MGYRGHKYKGSGAATIHVDKQKIWATLTGCPKSFSSGNVKNIASPLCQIAESQIRK